MADPFILDTLISNSLFTSSPAVTTGSLIPMHVRLDLEKGGTGRIVGTVKEKAVPSNLPLVRQVVLHEMLSHLPVAETWSDTAGNYSFEYIANRYTYYVVSFDHTNSYRAVIADNLSPESM